MRREAGVALAVYASATAFLFHPYLLQGRVVFETGTLYHIMPTLAGPPPGVPLVPHSNDNIGHYGTILSFLSRHLREGEIVFWNPYTYNGHPMHAANLYPPFSPVLAPPLWVLPWIDALHVLSMTCVTFGGFFFFLMARRLRRSFAGGLIGGAIWSMSSFTAFFLIGPGNVPTLMFLPLEVLLLHAAAASPRYRLYGLFGLIAGADYLSTGLQFFAVNMIVCAVAAVCFSRRRSHFVATATAVVGAVLIAGPVLLPFLDLMGMSTRVDATSNLRHADPRSLLLIPTAAFPRLYGGVNDATDLSAELGTRELFFNLHLGTVGTLSLLLALFGSGRRRAAAWLAGGVAAAFVAMATPPAMTLVSKLPLVRMTSTYYLWHPMLFALALAAAAGGHRLLLLRARDRRVVAWCLRALLCLTLALTAISVIHATTSLPHRWARFAWWFGLHNPALAVPLATLLVMTALLRRRTSGRRLRLVAVVAVAAIETSLFVHHNQVFSERRFVYAPTGLEGFAAEPGRILVRTEGEWWFSRAPNVPMAYRLRTPEIHNPLRPRFFEELIQACKGGEGDGYSRSVGVDEANLHELRTTSVARVAIWNGAAYTVRAVPDAVPRAYVVHDARVLADRAERLRVLGSADYPLGRTVVLESGTPEFHDAPSPPTAAIVVDSADDVAIETVTSAPGFLVLRDSWYPGWEATVDGVPAPVLKADHAFRAVKLDAGTHRLEFRYRPRSVRNGFMLLGLGLAILAVLSLWPRRRDPEADPAAPARG